MGCHNHLYPTTSPRKSNWLEECDYRFGGGSDEDCMSLQEASWGTETLRRLEEIHTSTDPNRIFQVVDGPGYAAVATTSTGPGDMSGASTVAAVATTSTGPGDMSGASTVGYVAAGRCSFLPPLAVLAAFAAAAAQ